MPAPRERARGGVAAALAGTLLGGGLAGGAGGAIGWAFAEAALETAELEKLLPFVAGLAAGVWLGGVAGCLLAMRLVGHPGARPTAGALAFALPLAAAAALALVPVGLDPRAGLTLALVGAPLAAYGVAGGRRSGA